MDSFPVYVTRPQEAWRIQALRWEDAVSAIRIIQRIMSDGGNAQLWCLDATKPDHGGHTIRFRSGNALSGIPVDLVLGDWIVPDGYGGWKTMSNKDFEATYQIEIPDSEPVPGE